MRKAFMLLLLNIVYLGVNGQIGQKMNSGSVAGKNLAGTWICNAGGQTLTLILFDDKNGEFEGESISYVNTDAKLTIKSGATSTTYNYKLAGNTMTLSGGDLTKPAVFSKNAGSDDNEPAPVVKSANAGPSSAKNLLGTWEAQGMKFTFKTGGLMLYNDKTMEYAVQGNNIHCQNDQAGVSVTYGYEINQNYLILRSNGTSLMLKRSEGGNTNSNISSGNGRPPFLGSWVSDQNEHLTFMEGGRLKLETYDLTYTYTSSTFSVNAPAGTVVFQYQLNGNTLTVVNNGKVTTYRRTDATGGAGRQQNMQGGIDQTMVGKWCQLTNSGGGYNTGGSYSSSECFVLEANGTYAYSSGSSRSVDAGSSASQGNDRGTWSVQGNTLIARSVTGAVNQYQFQKQNNKNGDPCLVINGTVFVTYYNKPGW